MGFKRKPSTSPLPVAQGSDFRDTTWLTTPVITDTSVNGKSQVLAFFFNLHSKGSNFLSLSANCVNGYSVKVYTAVNGSLISTTNSATATTTDMELLYSSATHQVSANVRQVYIEVVSTTGTGNITLVVPTLKHPSFIGSASFNNIVAVFASLPLALNMSSKFSGLKSLRYAYVVNLAGASTCASLFANDDALKKVVVKGIGAGCSTVASMFSSCVSLESVKFNVGAGTLDMSYVCNGCWSLKSVEFLSSLSNVTNATAAFAQCYALESLEMLSLTSVTTIAQICAYATALRSVRLETSSALTSTSNAFYDCRSLESVFIGNLSSVTNCASMFYKNTALVELILPSMPLTANNTTLLPSSNPSIALTSLRRLIVPNLLQSNGNFFPLMYTSLSAEAANDFVDSLGTSNAIFTIDLRNNVFTSSPSFNAAALQAKFPNATLKFA